MLWSTQSWAAASRESNASVFSRVAEDARLGEHHPLRQMAHLQLADYAVAQGRLDVARAEFERTGLTEEQCSLVGAIPDLKRTPNLDRSFPDMALNWGFEGWITVEFDVAADGSTVNNRALVTYPSFVFVDASLAATRRLKYTASYRPSGGPACASAKYGINFAMPQMH